MLLPVPLAVAVAVAGASYESPTVIDRLVPAVVLRTTLPLIVDPMTPVGVEAEIATRLPLSVSALFGAAVVLTGPTSVPPFRVKAATVAGAFGV